LNANDARDINVEMEIGQPDKAITGSKFYEPVVDK